MRRVSGRNSLFSSVAGALSLSALLAMAAMLLWLAGRPLSTPDMWFHLEAGEAYWEEGPWPVEDPMLFTAHDDAPIQHEWLFGVALHLIDKAAGFQGLRVTHVILAGIALVAAALLFRGAGVRFTWAVPGLCAFVVLSWQRLFQLRPDLVSIPATFLLFALLLRPGPLGWKSLGALLAVTMLWANIHSLFAVSIAVAAAGGLGWAFRRGFLRSLGEEDVASAAGKRAKTIGVFVVLMAAVSLVNPRGADQLLTFFHSSSETAVWAIQDEWHAFHPLFPGPPHNSPSLPWLTWAVADGVIFLFGLAALFRFREFHRRPSGESLDRLDPVLFMVSSASTGAMFISLRFLWLGIFPLIYAARAVGGGAAGKGPPAAVSALSLALSVSLLAAYPGPGRWSLYASDVPRDPGAYLETPVNRELYTHEGVAFLRETAVEGRLFNPYLFGGYFGYHLSPRLRTFIDGRTEHYPASLFAEYRAVTRRGRTLDGRSYLGVLDRYKVDFFYAVGGPAYGYRMEDTLRHLEGVPGWTPVFREADHVIYMRLAPRNRVNMKRIEEYYDRLKGPLNSPP